MAAKTGRDKLTFLGSLRTKIVLGIGLVLVIVLGTFVYVDNLLDKRALLENEEERALEISDTLMKAIEHPMLEGEMEAVEAIVQRVNILEAVRVVNISDLTGRIKYSGISDNIGSYSQSEAVKKALRTNTFVKNLERYGGERILAHAIPIPNEKACFKCHGSEKKTLGVLLVGTPWEPVVARLSPMLYREIVWFIVCVAVVGGVILALLHYLVITPIGLLTRSATLIAKEEDLSYRVPIKTNDEIGRLGTAFNQMTASVQKSQGELLEVQGRLRGLVAELERRRKELEDFTYIVSHDLKEPLRGITSFSQFVIEDYGDKLDEEGKDYLITIKESGERLKVLIDDLLTLSRVTRTEVSLGFIEAKDIIKEAIERVKYSIDERSIELVVPQDLPTIYCNKTRMVEVFGNLLSNAAKFTDKEKPRITIGYQDMTDYDQFYVQDNGIGIEKEYCEKIFGMFQRLHKREDYEGTGAGLHIAQKIMEMHHGRIWVESELGLGSTFYLTLPKKKEP